MEFALSDLDLTNRYKLLSSVVVPRPIAWITSLDEEGRLNAAPYSYFNIMGTDPPIVTIGPQYQNRFQRSIKDTAANIRTRGVFVINVVSEAQAAAMNQTAGPHAAGVSELEVAGLHTAPSVEVGVPRIAGAPACLECREHATLLIGHTRVVIGEVLHLYLRDDVVDPERFHIDFERLAAVGRLGGGFYTRTRDRFTLDRPG